MLLVDKTANLIRIVGFFSLCAWAESSIRFKEKVCVAFSIPECFLLTE